MKLFDPFRDIKEQVSSINEVNVYGGSIFSGAYVGTIVDANIKKFNHWVSASASGSYYHSVYSTHITASNTVELAGITFGFSISSTFYPSASCTNKEEKNKIYRLFAKRLLGSADQRFSISGTLRDELIFINLNRSQHKDELKRESITIKCIGSGSGNAATAEALRIKDEETFSDTNAANSYFQDDTAGDYAWLKSGSDAGGVVYYKAGILVLAPEIVSNTSSLATNVGNFWSGTYGYASMVVSGGGGKFDNTIDAMRYRLRNLSIINQTNLRSTFYFCRALNDEFNYSSNPTFVDSDKRIIPTSGTANLATRTYITKVGLRGDNDETLAVAALSEPLKKDFSGEIVLKVRLDF